MMRRCCMRITYVNCYTIGFQCVAHGAVQLGASHRHTQTHTQLDATSLNIGEQTSTEGDTTQPSQRVVLHVAVVLLIQLHSKLSLTRTDSYRIRET